MNAPSLDHQLLNLLSCHSTWREAVGSRSGAEVERITNVALDVATGSISFTITQRGQRGRKFTVMIPAHAIHLIYSWFIKGMIERERINLRQENARLREENRKLASKSEEASA